MDAPVLPARDPLLPDAPQLLITKRFERLDRDAQHVRKPGQVAGDGLPPPRWRRG